ncbi:conserved hypothetical protein [Ricinus communis]|uniref:S-protein homolog n=1 Tax=Ricinus communis TaxID=3988 RepID=B9SD63_RICCO|nr:conserved hypothetical protein [Ricinus communis]
MTIHESKKCILCVALFLLLSIVSSAEESTIKQIWDYLVPTVKVSLANNATHNVDVMCGGKDGEDLIVLKPGERISWQVLDVMFPLAWCYAHVNDTYHGVFWAYQVRLQCIQCNWEIQNDGVYLIKPNGEPPEPHTLFVDGEYF